MTTVEQKKRLEWESRKGAVKCQCGRDKILYRCYQEGCQENKNFCIECRDDAIHKHLSNIVKCFEVIANSDTRWSLINERYDNFMTLANASYQKVESLVKYFEAASIDVPLNQGGP
jgi:hypothetical protein